MPIPLGQPGERVAEDCPLLVDWRDVQCAIAGVGDTVTHTQLAADVEAELELGNRLLAQAWIERGEIVEGERQVSAADRELTQERLEPGDDLVVELPRPERDAAPIVVSFHPDLDRA